MFASRTNISTKPSSSAKCGKDSRRIATVFSTRPLRRALPGRPRPCHPTRCGPSGCISRRNTEVVPLGHSCDSILEPAAEKQWPFPRVALSFAAMSLPARINGWLAHDTHPGIEFPENMPGLAALPRSSIWRNHLPAELARVSRAPARRSPRADSLAFTWRSSTPPHARCISRSTPASRSSSRTRSPTSSTCSSSSSRASTAGARAAALLRSFHHLVAHRHRLRRAIR